MALYAFYVRWLNHSENRSKVDPRVLYYEDTDTIRQISFYFTFVSQIYLIQRWEKTNWKN
jgi:hypothetical protein